jgi:hypothetical protein
MALKANTRFNWISNYFKPVFLKADVTALILKANTSDLTGLANA